MSDGGMLDVGGFVAEPVLGYGTRGRHVIYNYRSRYFGVCDMIVETVETDPKQESPIYLENRRIRLLKQAQTRLHDAIFT